MSDQPLAWKVTESKPMLRGIPDVLATLVALPLAMLLIACARPGVATVSAVVYGITLVIMLGTSALYHAPMWSHGARGLWRRLDHSAIYIYIAGCYTPACLLALKNNLGTTFLSIVWIMSVLGFLKSFLWPHAPRVLTTIVYIGVGYLAIPYMPELHAGLGNDRFLMLAGGGVLYTIGALVYAKRWPNPAPRVFGYHEVMHLFVIAASACHFVMFWDFLT